MLLVRKSIARASCSSQWCFQHGVNQQALRVCTQKRDNSSQWVPEKLLIKEEDKNKYYIDPKVKKLAWKFKYCEYLERRSLRYGSRKNATILNRIFSVAKGENHRQLMETQVFSSALKYLTKETQATDADSLEKEALEMSDAETGLKPIHMPYASTDSYEESEISQESIEKISELNEEYKKVYEEYLRSKNSNDARNLSEIVESVLLEKNEENSSKSAVTIPSDWMTAYEQYNDFSQKQPKDTLYGTADPNCAVSSVPCGGCGALLHCQDSAIPGYLPGELFKKQPKEILSQSICQRCHFMKHYETTLDVKVSAEEYPALLSHIKRKTAAVLMIVDLTDFPCSIWPGVVDILGNHTHLYIVGNKVDLLPNDGPNFLKNVENSLLAAVTDMGIFKGVLKGVKLISAKTGFGIESLITTLQTNWKSKGDVYLIGCTNVGKSSVFNALIQSDFCKGRAKNFIHRATVSPWPGTTLNLLKFPILSASPYRRWLRTQRLVAERIANADEQEYRNEKFIVTSQVKYAALQGHVGETFGHIKPKQDGGYFGLLDPLLEHSAGRIGLDTHASWFKLSKWCYDTPGTILPEQVLHLLTTEELMLTLPRYIISPRTFVLFKKQTLFLAGLGRFDYINGPSSIICTVFASHNLPVTICHSKHADTLYKELLETEAFRVPKNDPERLKLFPDLQSKNFEVEFEGNKDSAADVILSSAGWISLQSYKKTTATVAAWTPMGKGIYLRTPALLARSVNLKGYRIPNSQAFTSGKRVYIKR